MIPPLPPSSKMTHPPWSPWEAERRFQSMVLPLPAGKTVPSRALSCEGTITDGGSDGCGTCAQQVGGQCAGKSFEFVLEPGRAHETPQQVCARMAVHPDGVDGTAL